MNNKYQSLLKIVFYGVITVILCFNGHALAGIPEPPMIIIGNLVTSGGLQVTSGSLQFRFTPTGGGTTVSIDATVGSFGSESSCYALIPLESPISGTVSDGVLRVDGSTTYTPSVRYEGATVSTGLPSPLTPERGKLIELAAIVVQPQGPTLAAEPGVNFGYVPVGYTLEKEFLLWNVGDATLTGSIRLDEGSDFVLMEGGNPVSEITINLAPGETLTVTIRIDPGVVDSTLSDTLQIRTNGGDEDRSVYGNSAAPEEPGNCDLNGNGVVDKMDLLILLKNWQTEQPAMPDLEADINGDHKCNALDLLMFLGEWHKESGS